MRQSLWAELCHRRCRILIRTRPDHRLARCPEVSAKRYRVARGSAARVGPAKAVGAVAAQRHRAAGVIECLDRRAVRTRVLHLGDGAVFYRITAGPAPFALRPDTHRTPAILEPAIRRPSRAGGENRAGTENTPTKPSHIALRHENPNIARLHGGYFPSLNRSGLTRFSPRFIA